MKSMMKETKGYNIVNFEDKTKVLRNSTFDSEAFKNHLRLFYEPGRGRKKIQID